MTDTSAEGSGRIDGSELWHVLPFAAAGQAEHQEFVGAGGGDDQGTLGHLLATQVGIVIVMARQLAEELLEPRRYRIDLDRAAQERHRLGQRGNGITSMSPIWQRSTPHATAIALGPAIKPHWKRAELQRSRADVPNSSTAVATADHAARRQLPRLRIRIVSPTNPKANVIRLAGSGTSLLKGKYWSLGLISVY